MLRSRRSLLFTGVLTLFFAGCGPESGPSPRAEQPQEPKTISIDAAQADRLKRVMEPLIQHMDNPIPRNQVKIAVWDDKQINAANAGGGNFFVTVGLLQRASDDQLRGVLAHEIAHADLGHVARTQVLATGLEAGIALLDQLYPGSSAITPLFGNLALTAYTRSEETEADAHGVEILRRAGQNGKQIMVGTLNWLRQSEGDSGGGFFDTHPATGSRIQAVQALP